jgi:Concanavalin A-like lectin/glucanases superfamily
MKCFRSMLWIGCLFLLTLPTIGCNVSGNGLGGRPDAADAANATDGPGKSFDTRPLANLDVNQPSAETGADRIADAPADAAPETAPTNTTDGNPDLVTPPDVSTAGPDLKDADLAPEDSAPTADVPIDFEVQVSPDVPLVQDGIDEPIGPQADSPVIVPLDGPALDTLSADVTPVDPPRVDLAQADLAPDLPTFLDTARLDLSQADVGPQPTSNWVVDNTTNIGGFTPTVMGAPTVTAMDAGTALCFDGSQDGLVMATNPIQGMQRFTIETLVFPEFTGTSDPRLIHIGDTGANTPRLVFQMRADSSGTWHAYIAFLWAGLTTNIEDTAFTHPSNQWYWLAVTYDGQTVRVYVNGALENSSALTFGPMTSGSISLGTRQNGQYYFPGCMRNVKVFSSALPASQLDKP